MAAPKTASVNGTRKGHPKSKKSPRKAKPKAKRRSRSRSDTATATQPRPSAAETSRINGSKSRGPTSEAGKARARYNALTHGMTAESVVLPGEDRAEFDAWRLTLHMQLQPRNGLEGDLIDRLARDSWMSNRTKNSAAARLEYRMRHQPLERARAEKLQVTKFGQYLLRDSFRPAGILLSEREGGARHPALLVLKLEATLPGCDWLLTQFDRLKQRALIPGNWLENDGFALVRLLGKYRGELTSDDLVAMVLLDSTCLAEESASQIRARRDAKAGALAVVEANALAEVAANKPKPEPKPKAQPQPQPYGGYDFVPPTYVPPGEPIEDDEDETEDERDEIAFYSGPACQEYRTLSKQFNRPDYVLDDALKLIANQPFIGSPLPRMEKLNPRSIEHARERLTRLIDEEVERLRGMRALHSEIAAADDVRANERLAFDPSPEADKERRYILSHDRLCNQTLATFVKIRKATNDGTIGEIEFESGVALEFDSDKQVDLATISPSRAQRAEMRPPAAASATDPSLARRASMGAPAPVEDQPIHTSPKRQRGASETPTESAVRKVPISVAHDLSQTLARQMGWGEKIALRNEPGAHTKTAQPEPPSPPVVAGTVSVPSSPAGDSPSPLPDSAGTVPMPSSSPVNPPIASPPVEGTSAYGSTAPVPSAELRAGPVPSSVPAPTAAPRTIDQGPMTNNQ
jgi:hypothetical protein